MQVKVLFSKQMKVLHKNGFTPEEFERFKHIIHDNVLTSMKQMIEYAEISNIPINIPESTNAIKNASDLTIDLIVHIKKLWDSKTIRDIWEQRNNFQIMSCVDYYFEAIDRITSPNYQPTQEDILRSKTRTTGVLETTFNASDVEFVLVDVGGQRSERRKWIHVFENVTAVIYLAALDAYDMNLEEAPDVNRMQESLRVFKEVTSSQWFRRTSFILFLNKSDLFEIKIKSQPLNAFFPDYGGGLDYNKALEFIRNKYKQHFGGQTLYHYETCAIDTKNIQRVFNAVKATLIANTLGDAGF